MVVEAQESADAGKTGLTMWARRVNDAVQRSWSEPCAAPDRTGSSLGPERTEPLGVEDLHLEPEVQPSGGLDGEIQGVSIPIEALAGPYVNYGLADLRMLWLDNRRDRSRLEHVARELQRRGTADSLALLEKVQGDLQKPG